MKCWVWYEPVCFRPLCNACNASCVDWIQIPQTCYYNWLRSLCISLKMHLSVRSMSHRHESVYQYIRVPVDTSSHVFQWQPFTMIQVLYEYTLPVNFTRTSSFCAGHVFIQPIWIKQHKICINSINTGHDAHLSILNCSLLRVARLVKLLTMYGTLLLFSQSIHSIRFHWRLSTDSCWVMCVYKWPRTRAG